MAINHPSLPLEHLAEDVVVTLDEDDQDDNRQDPRNVEFELAGKGQPILRVIE
ncbi:MAG: hypothetical protein PUH08_04435 [Treponema sp.]|nr:hypothetical protein [Treponema sp.]